MAEYSKSNINGVPYDLKDAKAREDIAELDQRQTNAEGRLNGLTNIPEGSEAASYPEIRAARVDGAGKTYDSLGAAMLAQVPKSAIVHELGDSPTAVMSQKETTRRIDHLHGEVFSPLMFRVHGKFAGGWKKVVVADNIKLVAGKTYSMVIRLESTPASSVYVEVMNENNSAITYVQMNGLMEYTLLVRPLVTSENNYVHIHSETYTGECDIEFFDDIDGSAARLSKKVMQLEDGYKAFEGAFIYGNYYGGNFDKQGKDRTVSVTPHRFNYDVTVRCDEECSFMIHYVDANGVYLSNSGWVYHGQYIEIPADTPFHICIVDMEAETNQTTVDIEENKTRAKYTTKIEGRFNNIRTQVAGIEYLVKDTKFNAEDFIIGERYDKWQDNAYKATLYNAVSFEQDVVIKGSDGYRFLVLTFDEADKYKGYSGWKDNKASYVVPAGERFRVSVEKLPVEVVTNIDEYANAISFSWTGMGGNTKLDNSNLFYIIKRNKYFSHIDVDYHDNLIIPSQSVFDVRRSKRLGFGMMELNVQKTSDGVFYAFHGYAGKFGWAFTSLDGTDITEVPVSSVTSEYIQENVRYRSKYSKYRVAPSTLREVLIECKKNEIVPLVQKSSGVVEFTKSIMGDNLFLLGSYEEDRGALNCGDCVCVSWLTGTAEQIIEKAQKSGGAYVCGINVTDSMYADYTEADWSDFIGKIHNAGYFVSCAYQSKAQAQMLLNAGIDIMASHGEINDLERGNLFDAESNLDYADFATNGTVSNGVLSLTAGQTVAPSDLSESVFLGGGSLHIIFKGKIAVSMGNISAEFESDGKKGMWFSSFFQEAVPTFEISAVDDTEILEISYKASKM